MGTQTGGWGGLSGGFRVGSQVEERWKQRLLFLSPGPLNIPLNSDSWTDCTIAFANNATLTNTKATLDASGTAQASFNIPKTNLSSAIGMVFYHAYLVYDANNNLYMASNPVPLKLGK